VDCVFGIHVNLDFDGRIANPRYPPATAEQLSDMNRRVKLHRVDRERDADTTRVAHRTDGPRLVHHLHDGSAMDVTQHIGVFWHHQLMQR